MLKIIEVRYSNYKSFKSFKLKLNDFNILVGPNNAGKSTIIGSFKLLSEALKKARTRKPILMQDPNNYDILGYEIELSQVPIATENVFHNYESDTPAIIRYILSDNSVLQIFFLDNDRCFFNYESESKIPKSPTEFRAAVTINIGFVPVLGPVEKNEKLYQKEAARQALLTHHASRNFRNIWHHFPEDFDEFKELINSTWPGLDIRIPELNTSEVDNKLVMFCPEERIDREIYWAGFGFQVWCQMLTYIIKNKEATIFLIDEPDIYLHSDLQRQLLNILRNLGPDIIIATHSTEIISESEMSEILIINKKFDSSKRIKDATQLRNIFQVLGSNLNPTLTQIAKSKRVLFVEGKDFQILSKFARILKREQVANRSDFAVVPVEGFNPTRLHAFKDGIEKTIGHKIISGVIFDKDYKTEEEKTQIENELAKNHLFGHIHCCKEIENFLLIPDAIDKALKKRVLEINERTKKNIVINEPTTDIMRKISDDFKSHVQSQLQSHRLEYEKSVNPKIDSSTVFAKSIKEFDEQWTNINYRLTTVSGKDFLSTLNTYLQEKYKITITNANILNAISIKEVPEEMKALIDKIEELRSFNF